MLFNKLGDGLIDDFQAAEVVAQRNGFDDFSGVELPLVGFEQLSEIAFVGVIVLGP